MTKIPAPGANKNYYILLAALFLSLSIAATAAIPFIKNPFNNYSYYGMPVNRIAPNFALQNTEGSHVELHDYHGKFVYLMFGYLGCDEVCHAQTLVFHTLNQQHPGNDVHFLYLGMDPENDTPEKISEYFDTRAANFDGLIAADVTHAKQVAGRYHAYFSIKPKTQHSTRIIEHPGYIYLIDPQGILQMIYSGSILNTEKMLLDLKQIQEKLS